eukprot:105706_1
MSKGRSRDDNQTVGSDIFITPSDEYTTMRNWYVLDKQKEWMNDENSEYKIDWKAVIKPMKLYDNTMDKGTHTYTEVGTGGYCAPEVIEPPPEGYDRRVDVFSYGVLLWEIYTRKNVFDQRCLSNINQLQQGIRPPIDNQCPQTFKDLINECWQFDPQNRPSFDRIVSILVKCSCVD